tara:strand:+ start:289 stop:1152 length:864 start_codon:yes stop_codon:yes gene_type:complete
MTGFGRGDYGNEDINVSTSISSLNSRFFDCKIKMSAGAKIFEENILNKVRKHSKRGRININIEIDFNANISEEFEINEDKLIQYIKIFGKIEKKYNVKNNLSIDQMINLPNLFIHKKMDFDDKVEHFLFNSVKIALEDLYKMRKIEGANLALDLKKRIDLISKHIKEIRLELKHSSDSDLKKYKEKISAMLEEININEDRLYQEFAILIEKKDITEEIIRMKSHLNLFNEFLEDDLDSGKKMNFLHQEMLREVNTIGSKTDNIRISHTIIKIKEELEKIKEQVQNIL